MTFLIFFIFLRVSVSFSKNLATKKSLRIGLENFQSQKKGSVSVSKIFGLKKSLGFGLENFGLKKVSVFVSKDLVYKKVSVMVSNKPWYFTYLKIESESAIYYS